MNKMLSHAQFNLVSSYMNNSARGVDRAVFNHEFGSGEENNIIIELQKFQNHDGGFGNGLEPDVRCSESSALASTVALQYLSKVKSSQKLELIQECFRFFANTYNHEKLGWEIIPREADNSPRAIWWNYSDTSSHWANPNAEILGYIYEYPELLSKELIDIKSDLTRHAIDYLQHQCDLSEMHELFCYTRLYYHGSDELRGQLNERLDRFVEQCVVKNPAERNGYCAVPLQVVDSPNARYYSKYAEVVPHDIDSLIDSLGEDGSWAPNWSWGRFDDDWQEAKREWQGYIAVNNMRILKAFNRI